MGSAAMAVLRVSWNSGWPYGGAKKEAAPQSGLQAGDGLAAATQDQNLRSYISEKRA